MANKKIRILVDQQIEGVPYLCNDVVELSAELAKPLVDNGQADDNKAAVAYCTGELGREVIAHATPAADPVEPPADQAADPAPVDA